MHPTNVAFRPVPPLASGPLPSAARFLGIAVAAVLMAAVGLGQEVDRGALTRSYLLRRQAYQRTNSAGLTVPHDFVFKDGLPASGITFANRVVDEAAKNWIPAHYDHGSGIAAADVDGDGFTDLYFTTQIGENQLWRGLGHGKFENATARAGVGLKDSASTGASFVDLANTGRPDLFVTTIRHGNHLYENLGGGKFREITKESGLDYSGHSFATVFFDFDNDGLVDVFLCNVGVFTSNEMGKGGFYKAYENAYQGHLFPERTEHSILYKNLGNHRFKDVTKEMNLVYDGWSGEATAADFNGDGYPDLYVTNMQGKNHYFENQGGKGFREMTLAYFPKAPWGAVQAKFFDHDNDGRLDLYVVDMHSDMNEVQMRLAENLNPRIEKAKSEEWCTKQFDDTYLGGASQSLFGNAFYANLGDGKVVERSDALNLETYWPWGITVADFNADGYQDIFVTSGMGFPFRYGINSMLLNQNGKRFYDAEFLLGLEPRPSGEIEIEYFKLDCSGEDKNHKLAAGKTGIVPFKGAASTRSAVALDIDGDGDLDLVTLEWNYRPQVLVSTLADTRPIHWLKLDLVGTRSNRQGLGALVKVHAGGKTYVQYSDGKSGYMAQSVLPLYFGLGDATRIDSIEIRWPSGIRQTVAGGVAMNRLLTVREKAD